MSRFSSTGNSFWSKPSLAYLIASCFSRAARFLKLSKSAVVRSKRSQFSSARPARSLSSANCSGVTVAASTGTSGSAAGASGVAGSFSICTFVRFMGHDFLVYNLNALRIDDSWASGNPRNGVPDGKVQTPLEKARPAPDLPGLLSAVCCLARAARKRPPAPSGCCESG